MATKLDPRLTPVIFLMARHMNETGHSDLANECLAIMTDIEASNSNTAKDGRSTAWNDKRKKEFGEKIRMAFEARRQAKGLGSKFLAVQYSDVKPVELASLEAVAEHAGLSVKTVQNKLSENPDGFSVADTKTRTRIFYSRASDPDAIDRLLYQEHLKLTDGKSSEGEQTYVLPTKNRKRF